MNIFVGNLNPSTVAESLRILFSEFGEVVSYKVIMDNATGTSRGFGFVEMAEKFPALEAIDNLDVTFFEGNIISVKEAKQNNTSGGGGRGNSHGGGNKSFRPRTPRPGGFNSNREGGFNSNREGGFNSNREGGINGNREGGFNRDRDRNKDGGYNNYNKNY